MYGNDLDSIELHSIGAVCSTLHVFQCSNELQVTQESIYYYSMQVVKLMLQNLETALAGGLGQMSRVKWLPNVSTRSRVPVFISGNAIQGMVTYIPVGGGAVEMAVGGKKWVGS